MNIQVCDVEGKPSVCFDTGLDPRSFARTKMSQSLIEPGYIVYPDGSKKVWKSSGVNDINGFMRVWGQHFEGERLDKILEKIDHPEQLPMSLAQLKAETPTQAALKAVAFWIRAKLLLGDVNSTLHPGAVFINNSEGDDPQGSVFFTPMNLAQRCLLVEGEDLNRFNCPDLYGIDASAFCAGAMLYKILTKSYPFPDDDVIFQDMREGVFLPLRLAAPGLDEKLSGLIQSALMLPVENKKIHISGTDILSDLLKILTEKESEKDPVSSLFKKIPVDERNRLEKESGRFLLRQKIFVKTRRFASQNKPLLWGVAGVLLFIIFIFASMSKNRNERLTTEGMDSDQVVYAYYDAFSSLNHMFMEACILGADKSDINAAAGYYAVSKARQAYEYSSGPAVVSARFWKESGGELPAPNVFGVTDMTLERLEGSEDSNFIVYSVNYLLWFPNEDMPGNRTDVLTLKRHRGDWRITEIKRTLN
jgi:hypothetical protein